MTFEKKKIALAVGATAAAFVASTTPALAIAAPVKNSGSYPFAGSLQFKKDKVGSSSNLFACGVILLSKQWVATPASCVTKFDGDELPFDDPAAFTVRLDSPEWKSGGITVDVVKFVKHPDWSSDTGRNDLALVKLASPVFVEPVKVAAPNPALPAVQVGWGSDVPGGDLSLVLKENTVRLLPDTDRRCVQSGLEYFAGEQTCQAANPVRGNGVTCSGDSGSPAVQSGAGQKPFVISMSLRGGCEQDEPNRPDISVNLSHYSKWMSSVMS